MAKVQNANPMLTKTGKKRLGPLNLKQLYDLLQNESKDKNKGKIRNRIAILERRGYSLPQETVAETTAEAV